MFKKMTDNKFWYFPLLAALLLMTACDKQEELADEYAPGFATVDAEEQCEYHFFPSNSGFNFSGSTIMNMESLLRDTIAAGIDNIQFMIVSSTPVPVEIQTRVKELVKSLMYKHGFIRSRIIDKGVCVYKAANPGVRIGVLQYKVKEPDCSLWSDYIGDLDVSKNTPRYGVSNVYNFEEMIANRADITSPREHLGARGKDAVSALSTSPGSGGSGGSGGGA